MPVVKGAYSKDDDIKISRPAPDTETHHLPIDKVVEHGKDCGDNKLPKDLRR